jgi:hypothetical protein
MVSKMQIIGESPAPADSADPSQPEAPVDSAAAAPRAPTPPDPTRYGDWEKNGRCIDF